MDKLTGLKLDLLEASKATETFNAGDIKNMFDQAGYVVEFDNDEWCYQAYEASDVDELIAAGLALVESLRKINKN